LRVALGTDSANTGGRHDLFEAMRLALMLPRVGQPDHARRPHGRDVLDMATRNGAAVLGLEDRMGRIAAGQLADLVRVRCRTAGTLALAPGEDAQVQHGASESVDSVMVDGRWLMRGQVLLAFDEAPALTEAEAAVAACRSARQRSWRRWAQRYRATDSSYLASTSGTFLVMLGAHLPAHFVPADKQDEILMLLRLDRALLELFAVRGRNITAYNTAKAKYGLS